MILKIANWFFFSDPISTEHSGERNSSDSFVSDRELSVFNLQKEFHHRPPWIRTRPLQADGHRRTNFRPQPEEALREGEKEWDGGQGRRGGWQATFEHLRVVVGKLGRQRLGIGKVEIRKNSETFDGFCSEHSNFGRRIDSRFPRREIRWRHWFGQRLMTSLVWTLTSSDKDNEEPN